MIEKLVIERGTDPSVYCFQLASKLNEVIDYLNKDELTDICDKLLIPRDLVNSFGMS